MRNPVEVIPLPDSVQIYQNRRRQGKTKILQFERPGAEEFLSPMLFTPHALLTSSHDPPPVLAVAPVSKPAGAGAVRGGLTLAPLPFS